MEPDDDVVFLHIVVGIYVIALRIRHISCPTEHSCLKVHVRGW